MGYAEERAAAEAALSAKGNPGGPSFPPSATRFRHARLARGMSEAQLAEKCGAQVHVCPDLELHDDEPFTCASVHDLVAIAHALDTPLLELLFGELPAQPLPPVSFTALADSLRALLAQDGVSTTDLSDRIGWELQPIFDDPRALATYNIDGLRDICTATGVDWGAVLQWAEAQGRLTTGCT